MSFWSTFRKRRVLPQLDVDIRVDFVNGSFVAPNPWMLVVARLLGQAEPVCRVSAGVSPLLDRIYVDRLWVDAGFRHQGYASSLLLAVAERMSPPGKRLPITALHEVDVSGSFWSALRSGRVSGLTVTTDIKGSDEMDQEKQRWRDSGLHPVRGAPVREQLGQPASRI